MEFLIQGMPWNQTLVNDVEAYKCFKLGSSCPQKLNAEMCVPHYGRRGVDCCMQSSANYVVFNVSLGRHWASCEKAHDLMLIVRVLWISHMGGMSVDR